MRHRDPRVGRHAHARGDAGHDLERDSRGAEGGGLLGPPAEDQGVAPLEPDHRSARPGVLDQDLVDRSCVIVQWPTDLPAQMRRASGGARSSSRGLARWS